MSDTEESGKEEGVRTYKPLAEELLTSLNLLRSNGDLFDITVIIGNKPFRAHKAVLASLSGYFQVMFTNPGFVEGNQSEIQIKEEGLIPESFDHLLDFMYTGKVNVRDIQAVVDLLQIAGFLQVKGAIAVCVDYLKEVALEQEISFETAFFMSSIANRLDHPDLKNIVDRYVGQSMIKFVETTEFLEQMTVEYLGELLMREDLNETSSEEEILEVVVAWLQFDWENRKSHVVALLTKIRLAVIPEHMLNEILGAEMEAIAKDILSKKEEIQSKQRGVLTAIVNGMQVSFQVTHVSQARPGFRDAMPRDISRFGTQITKLVSHAVLDTKIIYPLTPPSAREARGTPFYLNEYDGIEDIEFGTATHKILTNLPMFLVTENNTEKSGWHVAQFAEAETCLNLIKLLLGGGRMWYICRLTDGKIAGSGYNYDMQKGDHPGLGHQLMARYPLEFSVARSKKIVPGWRLATYEEVEDNLSTVKSLLKGKRAKCECLLQGGKISGEAFEFQLQEGTFFKLDHQIVVKLQN